MRSTSWRSTYFYPRPPRGGRLKTDEACLDIKAFLSTPSARRATESLRPGRRPCNFYPRPPRGGRHHPPGSGHPRKNFYPRPPRGGRLPCAGHQIAETRISIHALREEGDIEIDPSEVNPVLFLSTPSARRATSGSLLRCPSRKISIHALREEGDQSDSVLSRYSTDFYPRPPRGGRQYCPECQKAAKIISIHALREEGD